MGPRLFPAGIGPSGRCCCPLLLLLIGGTLLAQQATIRPRTSDGIDRLEGVDAGSGISFVRLFLDGRLVSVAKNATINPQPTTSPSTPPRLTAQCTSAAGKQRFELFADFGGVSDRAFYAPFKPSPGQLFAPQLVQANITMEFIGYTKVPAVKRRWETLTQPEGEYRYNPPSSGSANLEDSTYHLRFLLALPTLRLTLDGQSAEFFATPWLDEIRREPLCKASKL